MAAGIIQNRLASSERPVLGTATGRSPLGTYRELAGMRERGEADFNDTVLAGLDEYVGLTDETKSYRHFTLQHAAIPLGLRPEGVYLPEWKTTDPGRECRRFEAFLERTKRTVQLLGIGPNGHIGFCEPGTPFFSRTRVVDLTERTRIANSPFFMNDTTKRMLGIRSDEDPYPKMQLWTEGEKGIFYDEVFPFVPEQAITQGIATMLEAEALLMLALGSTKTCALFKVLFQSPHEKIPASALRFHPDATIIADLEAVSFPSGKQNEGVYEV